MVIKTLEVVGSVASAGDINRDGYADVIIGVPYANYKAVDQVGAAYVIYGSSSLNTTYLNETTSNTGFTIYGAAIDSYTGYSVSGAGDINNDGYDDIIIGAPHANNYAGISYIIYGKTTNSEIVLSQLTANQGIAVYGANDNDESGFSVSGAGDINNDGYDDVIIGAPGASPYYPYSDNLNNNYAAAGISYLIYGSSQLNNIDLGNLEVTEGFKIFGYQQAGNVGYSASGAGDVNNDGYNDIVVGAPRMGFAYVILGSSKANSISNSDQQTIYLETFTRYIDMLGAAPYDYSGWSVASAGDVNGDNIDDIIIGAYWAGTEAGNYPGVSYVLFGDKNLDISLASNFSLPEYAELGFSITGVNKNDHCGWSVSGSGDINNDGYADIIIGAPNANSGIGVSYVIFGSNDTSSIQLPPTADQGFSITGSVSDINSGWSVSNAGDINNDGYSDVVIGAPYSNDNQGVSYVIFGSENPSTIQLPPEMSQGFNIFGSITNGESGYSVSGAGDINNDTYADIIIGAPYANSGTGISYVIFGSKNPASTINLPPAASQGFSIYGATTGDNSGWSVSGAGDVNRDGYDDVIIGAPYAIPPSTSLIDAGVSYVIFGKANLTNIHLESLSPKEGFIIIGGSENDKSGWSVGAAGDVNRDGYDDVIVGALEGSDGKGISYVIYGFYQTYSSSDPINLADFTLSTSSATSQNNQGFAVIGANQLDGTGLSVNGAGDFNGDSFDDVIIGAPGTNSKQGTSYVVYGAAASVESGFTPTPSYKPSNSPKPTSSPTTWQVGAETWLNQNKNWFWPMVSFVFVSIPAAFSKKICFSVLDSETWPREDFSTTKNYIKSYIRKGCESVFLAAYDQAQTAKNNYENKRYNSKDSDRTFSKDGTNKVELADISKIYDTENPIHNNNINDDKIPNDFAVGDTSNKQTQKSTYCVIQAVYDIKFDNPELQRVYDNRLGLGEAIKVLSDSTNKNEISTVKANEELPSVKEASPTIADFSRVSMSLSARNFIEAIPLIKYASQNIIYPLIKSYLPETLKNISYPNTLDSKPALFTAHLATGITAAMLMPEEVTKAVVVASSASSLAFGVRLTASHYLAEYRKEKPVDVTESLKQCAVTVFAYTMPSLATCALAQTVMPGYQCQELDLWSKLSFAGSDCYAMYKSTQEPTLPTTANTAVPYIVDTATAVAAYTNGYGLMGIVSSVVTADWMSRMALNFAKEVSFLGTEENFN